MWKTGGETVECCGLLRLPSDGLVEPGCIFDVVDGETKVNRWPNLRIVFCITFSKGNISSLDNNLSVHLPTKFI